MKVARARLSDLFILIVLVAVLFVLLRPTNGGPHRARMARARMDAIDLVNAIERYQATYGRFPTAQEETTNDFTYGGASLDRVFTKSGAWSENNSEVIAILLDFADLNLPDGTTNRANANHQRNPEKIKFLNARITESTNDYGIGPDLVYRDPWGNPFIISMDLNGDGKCEDEFYRRQKISQSIGASGFMGLSNIVDASGNSDHFSFNTNVVVWSLGPDKKADPGTAPHQGVNKDNILSWK